MKPAVYVAGTSRHCGKTSVALGLFAALREQGHRVAYMKPVGQRTVEYKGLTVDEDVALIHEVFDIDTCPSSANPVTIPSGFTHQFLTGRRSPTELIDEILNAYEMVTEDAEMVVVEGTGHAGVGAVIGVSNAEIARLLGCTAIVVSGGGIGRPIDEFELSRSVFEEKNVPILGMICNKVYPEKMTKIESPLRLWLQKHGFKLLGLFPYEPVMSELSMAQIADDMEAEVLAGHNCLARRISRPIVGAGRSDSVIQEFQDGTLMITPGDREDVVLAAICWDQTRGGGSDCGIGVCVTSSMGLSDEVLRVADASGIPIIWVPGTICDVSAKIRSWVGSILSTEEAKIDTAKRLVQRHLDLDAVREILTR